MGSGIASDAASTAAVRNSANNGKGASFYPAPLREPVEICARGQLGCAGVTQGGFTRRHSTEGNAFYKGSRESEHGQLDKCSIGKELQIERASAGLRIDRKCPC